MQACRDHPLTLSNAHCQKFDIVIASITPVLIRRLTSPSVSNTLSRRTSTTGGSRGRGRGRGRGGPPTGRERPMPRWCASALCYLDKRSIRHWHPVVVPISVALPAYHSYQSFDSAYMTGPAASRATAGHTKPRRWGGAAAPTPAMAPSTTLRRSRYGRVLSTNVVGRGWVGISCNQQQLLNRLCRQTERAGQ